MKTIKTILLIALLASILPLTTHAWGKKKNKNPEKPENAWEILLSTNNPTAKTSSAITTNSLPNGEQEQPFFSLSNQLTHTPSPREHKTAPQQFATAHSLLINADKARADKDFVSAVGLYDKAIKSYISLKSQYPDWQPAVISFRLNHCTYHLKALLREANDGKIKLDPSVIPNKTKPSKQEKASSLSKAKQLLIENKNEEARDLLIKTLMTDPDNMRIRLMIGIVQCRLKQYNDAIYLLETLIEENPGDANAHVILATAYFGLNSYKNAIAQLNKALELDSFHKAANFNMAKVLLKTTPDDTELIAKYYIKAVELGSIRDPKLDAAILK